MANDMCQQRAHGRRGISEDESVEEMEEKYIRNNLFCDCVARCSNCER